MCAFLGAASFSTACDDPDGGFEGDEGEEREGSIDAASFAKCKAKFPDLESYWYNQEICTLVQAGKISGYPDGTFRPNQGINRGEFAALLTSAFNLDADKNCLQTPFADVKSGWLVRPLCAVREAGLMSGFPDGTFGPGLAVTRTQVMVTLTPLKPGEKADPHSIKSLKAFADWTNVPKWAFERVAAAVGSNIMPGQPFQKLLLPEFPASRGEVARAVFYRQQFDMDVNNT